MIAENYTERDLQFYPTPKSLLDEICKGFDWKRIKNVLEPSARKGDIVNCVQEKLNRFYIRCFCRRKQISSKFATKKSEISPY